MTERKNRNPADFHCDPSIPEGTFSTNKFNFPTNLDSQKMQNLNELHLVNKDFAEDKRKTGVSLNENDFKIDKTFFENQILERNEPSSSEEESEESASFHIKESPISPQLSLQLKTQIVF